MVPLRTQQLSSAGGKIADRIQPGTKYLSKTVMLERGVKSRKTAFKKIGMQGH